MLNVFDEVLEGRRNTFLDIEESCKAVEILFNRVLESGVRLDLKEGNLDF